MKVSLLVEVPEELQESLQGFLDENPQWNQDRAFSAAMSLFLLQNNSAQKVARRIYLDTLFDAVA